MATLNDGELFFGLQGRQPLAYVITDPIAFFKRPLDGQYFFTTLLCNNINVAPRPRVRKSGTLYHC